MASNADAEEDDSTTDDLTRYESIDNKPTATTTILSGGKAEDDAASIAIARPRERRKERCLDRKWSCHGKPFWRIYMQSYMESRRKVEKEDVPKRKMSPDVPGLPRAESIEQIFPLYKCFPLGGFQFEHRPGMPTARNRRGTSRIWRSMRTGRSSDVSRGSGKLSGSSAGKWPCLTADSTKKKAPKMRERKSEKRRDAFPCDPPRRDKDECLLREQSSYFASRKELGHVRAPVACPDPKKLFVDRATGERPGLVDGDYVIVELAPEGRDKRVYANVALRGLKGMHLPELGPPRERRNTWKFCFYQAIVALLAKTQFRYKYVWSGNVDYIYDHAWTLYTHIGTINVKNKQRLDDVVVYNYKYSIEIELIQQMANVAAVREVDWNYTEGSLRKQMTLRRKDPLRVRVELGCRKITDSGRVPVHEGVEQIEEWFDKLPVQYRNCIFRTTRFSLAFWLDGLFWYLYNPYRCDEFGFWHDDGYACIVKFCSKDSLRRHLMILLLRAYALEATVSDDKDEEEDEVKDGEKDTMDIGIFHVTFHCCQLENWKLLQRGAAKGRRYVDESASESFDDIDAIDEEEDARGTKEKVAWLRSLRVTWCLCDAANRKEPPGSATVSGAKARWHQYHVEEFNKLFSLWGEVHITDGIFDRSNRGMQAYACYVVCSGMTRITAPEYWTPRTLDAIVMCGDRYYTHSRHEAELKSARSEYAHVRHWHGYLAASFKIGETLFEAKVLPAIRGRLYGRSAECLWHSLERTFARHHFGILTCENACLGVFKFCGAYYMCDANSFGPPLFQYGRGAAYLLRATSFYKFMTVLVLTIGSSECSPFSLDPIEILKVVEVGPAADRRARLRERGNRFGGFAKRRPTLNGRKGGRWRRLEK